MKFGKTSYFENPILLFIYLPHILTTSQLLCSNLGEGGAVRDNAGAAVCMVGAALKSQRRRKTNCEWRELSGRVLRVTSVWHLDSSTTSKVCTLGHGAFQNYSACHILTLNVSRAHRGP